MFLLLMIHLMHLMHMGKPLNCTQEDTYGIISTRIIKKLYEITLGYPHVAPKPPYDETLPMRLLGNMHCGQPVTDVAKAILNGNDAPEKAWPWQALLIMKYPSFSTFCGGALISKSWVLTAAHCVRSHDISVTLGALKYSDSNGGRHTQKLTATKVLVHEGYDLFTREDDIALVKLNQEAVFNDNVSPVCLPKMGQTLSDERLCYSTGWGKVDGASLKTAETLQQVRVDIMPQGLCVLTSILMLRSLPMDGRRLCLDINDYNRGLCLGDSGGPMTCKIDGKFTLYGIHSASLDDNCSTNLLSGALTRVSEYIDWIVTNMEKNA